MTHPRHRLFCPQARAEAPEVMLAEDQAHYVGRVLRLASGTRVRVFDGHGAEFEATLEIRGKSSAVVRDLAPLAALPESPLPVTLYQCIARGDRMDLALQKATELGVTRLQPVLAERTEVRLSGKRLERRLAHWQGVVRSACEQCGRAFVPEVAAPVSVPQLTNRAEKESLQLLGSVDADSPRLASYARPATVAVLVGPEGGLTDAEERLLEADGWQPVSFGPRILRTETAGPAALAMLQATWGDAAPD